MHGFDRREYMAQRSRPYTLEGTRRPGVLKVTWDEDFRDNTDVDLPGQVRCEMEVCCTCDGHGTVVDPGIDAGGITAEDFAADPDFREAYTNGMYDIACPECRGLRVVPVPRFNDEVTKLLAEHEDGELADYKERLHESRWGL